MKKLLNTILLIFGISLLINCSGNANKSNETADISTNVSKEEPKKPKTGMQIPEITENAPKGLTAKNVVETYFKAIGGEAKAEKVETLCIVSKSRGLEKDEILIDTAKYAKPDKQYLSKSDKKTGKIISKLVYNGTSGYMEYQGNKVEFGSSDMAEFAELETMIFPDFKYKNGKLKGIAKVNNQKSYMINYENKKIYYNIKTGLKMLYLEIKKDKDGNESITKSVSFSDYKKSGQLLFPFNTVEKETGDATITTKAHKILVNSEVSDNNFD